MRIAITALLLVPAVALAGSAFDGTWKTKTDSMKITGKPDIYVLAGGTYSCNCVPAIKVKADGTDQKVTGHDYYDTVAVKVVDANSVLITQKQAGKVIFTTSMTSSADGKTLTGKFTDHTGSKEATGSFTEQRVAAAAAGAHAISGTWQQGAMSDANDALRTVSYQMSADHFSMHWNGQSYDAKFDGKEYPVSGDAAHTLVTLKRIDDNTVEETDQRNGKVTDKIRLAAAKDGKTVNVTDVDQINDQTVSYTLEKQ
jgi:uncharacterized protein (DUF2147 family)